MVELYEGAREGGAEKLGFQQPGAEQWLLGWGAGGFAESAWPCAWQSCPAPVPPPQVPQGLAFGKVR